MTCDRIRAAALDPGTLAPDWQQRPEVVAHVGQCAGCREFLVAFSAGERVWELEAADAFAAAVLVRTAGVDAILADLPLLAEMDPGPGFAERVLLATSRRPEPAGWRARWAARWGALVRRPRFAWEAAYVATVCWVLVFGNPVGAIEWSAASIGTVARERLAPPVNELRANLDTWRTRLAAEPPAAGSAAAGPQVEADSPAMRIWQAAVEWLRRTSSSLVDALARAWDAVDAWLGASRDDAAPSAEPPAEPARSPQ